MKNSSVFLDPGCFILTFNIPSMKGPAGGHLSNPVTDLSTETLRGYFSQGQSAN